MSNKKLNASRGKIKEAIKIPVETIYGIKNIYASKETRKVIDKIRGIKLKKSNGN